MGKKSRLATTGLSYEKRVQAAKKREEEMKKDEAKKYARAMASCLEGIVKEKKRRAKKEE